jgi:AraC-like DNA-binding protein
MEFTTRVPPPPLRAWVALLWEWRGLTLGHGLERLMPNGEAALVVNLSEDVIRVYEPSTLALAGRTRGAVWLGAHATPSAIDSAEQEHVFGIQFQPGGAFAFLEEPMGELANQHVALEELWGLDGLDLRVQLLEAASPRARFAVAERYLWQRLARASAPHPAVRFALAAIERAPEASRVGMLAAEVGLSGRRFGQLFEREVGLTPKAYCRVRRLQRVLNSVFGQPPHQVDWARVAIEGGYYDQAHFIHEFRALAGMRPSDYLVNADRHPNHVAVR